MPKLRNSMFTPVVGAVRRVASSRLAIAVLAVAVTAAAVGGAAAAAIPDEAGVIHGCYNQVNGGLRIVDSGATCKPGEVALPWNQNGVQGPAGPPGPPGPPAPTAVAVSQIIPPTPIGHVVYVPVTLHLTTGTWHVTAENGGGSVGGCRFTGTTGTILGDVVGRSGSTRMDLLVDVSAASATVTTLCPQDSRTQMPVAYSQNIFAVPVVMQQQ